MSLSVSTLCNVQPQRVHICSTGFFKFITSFFVPHQVEASVLEVKGSSFVSYVSYAICFISDAI